MAYDVVISNTTYEGIDSVEIPLDGGGNATFIDGNALTALATGTITSATLDPSVERNLREYAFQRCTSLESVSIPNLKNVPQYAFQGCTALANVDFWDTLLTINNCAFQGCTALTGEISLPAVTGVTGTNAFQGCTGITKFTFGFTESATNCGVGTSFKGCTALTTVDLAQGNYIANSAFESCTALTTLILRRTAGIVTLQNTTPFLNGTSAVDVYVPSALKSTYEADSKWSAQSVVTFKTIEGSAYA